MKVFWRNLLIVALLMLTHIAQASNTNETSTPDPKSRPKVGLVLSGGGAKGAAHIGVLKYLEEASIPIDYIAGTSMGSIVGGMFAMGYSSREKRTRRGRE